MGTLQAGLIGGNLGRHDGNVSSMDVTTTLSAPLDHLTGTLAELQAEDVSRLPGPALAQDLVELHRLRNLLDAQITRRVGQFDRSCGYAASGALSAAAWLRWACRLSPAAASEQVRLARQLPELPGTARAFAEGEIGPQHAAVITRTTEELGPQAARQAEPDLLEAARRLHPQHLRRLTRHLRHVVDPEGALDEALRQREGRYLHLSETLDGVWYLDGRLDPEAGTELRTVLDALAGPAGRDDRRSAAQRRADALAELARGRLDSGELPRVGGQRPHLSLFADLETLQGQLGSRAAELDWGQPVSGETARRLACDAALTPILVDKQGEPLSVGRTTRVVPPALRRALVARDRTCRWPGCDRPACWTDVHHLRHWMDGRGDQAEQHGPRL